MKISVPYAVFAQLWFPNKNFSNMQILEVIINFWVGVASVSVFFESFEWIENISLALKTLEPTIPKC